MSEKQANDPAFLQRYAAMLWECPGDYTWSAAIWLRTRATAEDIYRRARFLMGIESDYG